MRHYLSLILFLCLACACTEHSPEDPGDTTIVTTYDWNADETELARQINQYRLSVGKNELLPINHICYKSQEHNLYMIETNTVSHANFDSRVNNLMTVLGATNVGENLAYNFSTPYAIMHAWLNSPSHKATLDGNYTHFGVSVSTSPSTGKKYITNIFIKK